MCASITAQRIQCGLATSYQNVTHQSQQMAIFTTDWSGELGQIKNAAQDLVETSLAPMIQNAIKQTGDELNQVVDKAGHQVQESIAMLSKEIHDQRSLTHDDLKACLLYTSPSPRDS